MAETTTETKEINGTELKNLGAEMERVNSLNVEAIQQNTIVDNDFEIKNGKKLFKIGHRPLSKGRPKGTFSIRQDLIKSLKAIKRTNSKLYQEIISSYWKDTKLRPFLLEIIDGKARQQVDFGGNMSNPIRIIEVRANIGATNEAK